MKYPDTIIQAIVTSEKGTGRAESENKYLLRVARSANKFEIRKAIQDLFGVTVLSVNTQIRHGGTKLLRNRRKVELPDWKLAVVELKQGDRIDIV